MEETSGPVIQAPFTEGPFSELISGWLDEGDRLSESAAAAPVPPATDSRLGRAVRDLRPVLQRHRLSVLVGLGLLPLVLVLGTHRGGPAPIAVAPAAVIPALLAPVVPVAPVAARDESQLSRGAQLSPAPSAEAHAAPVTPAPAPSSALARAGSDDGKAAPNEHHHHHHHHHHHTSSAPHNGVASAGRAVRR
jgi:hypothetical protein